MPQIICTSVVTLSRQQFYSDMEVLKELGFTVLMNDYNTTIISENREDIWSAKEMVGYGDWIKYGPEMPGKYWFIIAKGHLSWFIK